MFDYLVHKKGFLTKLGEFIKEVIIKSDFTVEEVNQLDRIKLAIDFLRGLNKYKNYLETNKTIDSAQILSDIARYIDMTLPKTYIKKKEPELYTDKAASTVPEKKVRAYGFTRNFGEPEYKKPVKPTISKQERELQNRKKKTDSNYEKLKIYLNEEAKVFLGSNDFKALLYVMNAFTFTKKTKPQVLKETSERFGVTQEFLKGHIKAMKLESQAFIAQKKEFGKMQSVTIRAFKERMAREID